MSQVSRPVTVGGAVQVSEWEAEADTAIKRKQLRAERATAGAKGLALVLAVILLLQVVAVVGLLAR